MLPANTKSTSNTATSGTIELRLRHGNEFKIHQISNAAPRECRPEEIPIVDLADIDGSPTQRQHIADSVRHAAENLGFFYIKNHGVRDDVIKSAQAQALRFFREPPEVKNLASKHKSKIANNGWSPPKSTTINPAEGADLKEGFGWSYSPSHDPLYGGQKLSPEVSAAHDHDEPHIWNATAHLKGFKVDTLAYWQSCISLARKLMRIFALSLSLPENHFDGITTFPGADGVYNLYPVVAGDASISQDADVGLGSHTDFQCFTLLWQDESGGLQILNHNSEWIWATPIDGTFVVNIGDFLSRLTNDRYKSTIHRAYNRGSAKERLSMPFFFGFNYDAECAVLPSCVDDDHPAKYTPITCGQNRYVGVEGKTIRQTVHGEDIAPNVEIRFLEVAKLED